MQEVFGEWPTVDLPCSSFDHWVWKYLDHPFGAHPIVVAVDGEDVVGVNSTFVTSLRLGDVQTYASYSGDLAISKKYRGQGISNKFYIKNEEVMERLGLKYLYFVTQQKFLVESWEKRYHRFPLPILNMVRIRDIELQLENLPMDRGWLMKTGYRALSAVNRVQRALWPIFSVSLEIEKTSFFPSDIDRLLDDNDGFRFIVNNRREFLNWRYCDSRAGDFNIYLAREANIIVGYLVTRVNRFNPGYPIGYIVDLLVSPGRRDVAFTLLEYGVDDLDSLDVNIVLCMVPQGNMLEHVYSSLGFIDSRKNLHLFTNINRLDELHLLNGITPVETQFNYGSIDSVPVGLPKN